MFDLLKTDYCESICQGCFCRSRTKVRGPKTIRQRPSLNQKLCRRPTATHEPCESFQDQEAPSMDPKQRDPSCKDPQVGPPMSRNSHIALIRTIFKPVFYHPQSPAKTPLYLPVKESRRGLRPTAGHGLRPHGAAATRRGPLWQPLIFAGFHWILPSWGR